MNELYFFLHIIVLIFFLLLSHRIGKGALACFFAVSNLLANLFVTKQISLFTMNITATDAYTVCAILSLNLIQEYFGKETASKIIYASTLMLLYFFIAGQIHLRYIPNAYDQTQYAFQKILSSSPRIVLSSIGIAFVSQKLDLLFFKFLKKKFYKLSFLQRSSLSFIVSQTIDTVLFTYLAIGHLIKNSGDVILFSMIVKMLSFTVGVLMIFLYRKKLPRAYQELETSVF